MNFLDLVNYALRESGADLDSLSNFTTMNSLQTKMKNWVSQAWREICMDRDEWEYMTGLAIVDIYPRIYVEDWNRAGGVPSAGATFRSAESLWGCTLVSVDSVEGTITNVNGLSAFIDISTFVTGTWPMLNEQFDELLPTPDVGAFVYKGWGRYNFQTHSDTVLISGTSVTFTSVEPQITTFYVQDVEEEEYTASQLTYVPYARFMELAPELTPNQLGKPQIITTTPDGRYDVWPRLDKHYVVKYNYTRAVNELSLTTDIPLNLSTEYHEIIAWKALIYYANYDANPTLLAQATSRYEFFKRKMERRTMPITSFGRSRFSRY